MTTEITNNQTLFLDRDGVINHQKEGGYILNWSEFKFYDGVLEAMQIFATRFRYVIVVTNQRGVGKGQMTAVEVEEIHSNMKAAVTEAGGIIHAIFYCPDVDNASPGRKPQTGMGHQAKKSFPDIDFSNSIMVGNSLSDMEFGKNLGTTTIFLNTTNKQVTNSNPLVDQTFDSLFDFATSL